jgi:hypothetical protein
MKPTTNNFLPIGYILTDDNGNTIAVLGEDRCFHLWEAGSWRAKQDMKIDKIHSPKPPSVRKLAMNRAVN